MDFLKFKEPAPEKKTPQQTPPQHCWNQPKNRCKVQTNHLPSDPHRAGRRFSSAFRETRSFLCLSAVEQTDVFFASAKFKIRQCFLRILRIALKFGRPEKGKKEYVVHVFHKKGRTNGRFADSGDRIQRSEDDI